MVTSRLPALVAAGLLVLGGCGEETGTTSNAQGPGWSDEPRVSCGGEASGWPVSAMDGGIESTVDRGEIVTGLERLAADAGIDAPRALQGQEIEDAAWFVLAETDAGLVIATGPWTAEGPGRDGETLSLEAEGDGWRATGWGDCRNLRLVVEPDRSWVEITPTRAGPDRAASTIDVMVSETECTSARDPRPFLDEPRVVEEDDSVTVYWTSRPVEGGANCPGNPLVEQQVELAARLGDRALLDGSTWPPTPVYPASGR